MANGRAPLWPGPTRREIVACRDRLSDAIDSRIAFRAPRTEVSRSRHQSSGSTDAIGPRPCKLPAAQTRASSPPAHSWNRSTAPFNRGASSTSAGRRRPPSLFADRPDRLLDLASRRASTPTAAPWRQRRPAIARPRPRPPPVTRTLSRRSSILLPFPSGPPPGAPRLWERRRPIDKAPRVEADVRHRERIGSGGWRVWSGSLLQFDPRCPAVLPKNKWWSVRICRGHAASSAPGGIRSLTIRRPRHGPVPGPGVRPMADPPSATLLERSNPMLWRHRCLVRALSAAGLLIGSTWGVAAFAEPEEPAPGPEVTSSTVDILQAQREGQVAVRVRGQGSDQIRVAIHNTSPGRLNIVLPPGLVGAIATGQPAGPEHRDQPADESRGGLRPVPRGARRGGVPVVGRRR